jgi:DNA uptake protein ComE-like DNA-binding protein
LKLFSAAEKRAALLLCILALAGAVLGLIRAGRRPACPQPFTVSAADSAALQGMARELDAGGEPLDVNGADKAALMDLEGIGPALAARIVMERDSGGPFRDAADLAARVRGVGPQTVSRLAGRIVFTGSTDGEKP